MDTKQSYEVYLWYNPLEPDIQNKLNAVYDNILIQGYSRVYVDANTLTNDEEVDIDSTVFVAVIDTLESFNCPGLANVRKAFEKKKEENPKAVFITLVKDGKMYKVPAPYYYDDNVFDLDKEYQKGLFEALNNAFYSDQCVYKKTFPILEKRKGPSGESQQLNDCKDYIARGRFNEVVTVAQSIIRQNPNCLLAYEYAFFAANQIKSIEEYPKLDKSTNFIILLDTMFLFYNEKERNKLLDIVVERLKGPYGDPELVTFYLTRRRDIKELKEILAAKIHFTNYGNIDLLANTILSSDPDDYSVYFAKFLHKNMINHYSDLKNTNYSSDENILKAKECYQHKHPKANSNLFTLLDNSIFDSKKQMTSASLRYNDIDINNILSNPFGKSEIVTKIDSKGRDFVGKTYTLIAVLSVLVVVALALVTNFYEVPTVATFPIMLIACFLPVGFALISSIVTLNRYHILKDTGLSVLLYSEAISVLTATYVIGWFSHDYIDYFEIGCLVFIVLFVLFSFVLLFQNKSNATLYLFTAAVIVAIFEAVTIYAYPAYVPLWAENQSMAFILLVAASVIEPICKLIGCKLKPRRCELSSKYVTMATILDLGAIAAIYWMSTTIGGDYEYFLAMAPYIVGGFVASLVLHYVLRYFEK